MLINQNDLTKPAIITGQQIIRYQQLIDTIKTFAALFVANGIQPGDRIGLFLYNRPELIYSYYACWEIAATAVAINNRLKAPEIARMLKQCQPRMIITEPSLYPELMAANPSSTIITTDQLTNLPQQHNHHIIHQDFPATIHFTSGTTATPKGVIHHFSALKLIAKTAAEQLQYTSNDHVLISQSLAHGFGFSMQLLPGLYAGSSLYLLPSFEANAVADVIQTHPITVMCLLPGFCWQLLQQLKNHVKQLPHRLRLCIVAGDMVPTALQQQFYQKFGIPISINYGMTESLLLTLNLDPDQQQQGSVGKPFPNTSIKIVDANAEALPAGEIGEVLIRSPYLYSDYLTLPDKPNEQTTPTHNTHWFASGDLGCLDAQGNLWLKGRKKLLISRGGSKFAPQEVEAACYQHPAIIEAGAIGIEKASYTTVIAFLVSSQPIDKYEFINFLHQQLADYKCPDQLVFLPALPKTASGKLDRGQLLAQNNRN